MEKQQNGNEENLGLILRDYVYLNEEDQNLRRVVDHIGDTCKFIREDLKSAAAKKTGTLNTSLDSQIGMDRDAEKEIIKRVRRLAGQLSINTYASEESRGAHTFLKDGLFSIVSDPLDGSSVFDVNISVGSIFAVHGGALEWGKTGRETLRAAMYAMYGPTTLFVYSTGKGVHVFERHMTGEFISIQNTVQMREAGSIYCPGGKRSEWLPHHSEFMRNLEDRGYTLRYSGALVSDVHHVLMKGGGVFSYPGSKTKPEGKLRMAYELQALAFLVEQAGGMATNGTTPILDIPLTSLDQTSPFYIGSRHEVELARTFLARQG